MKGEDREGFEGGGVEGGGWRRVGSSTSSTVSVLRQDSSLLASKRGEVEMFIEPSGRCLIWSGVIWTWFTFFWFFFIWQHLFVPWDNYHFVLNRKSLSFWAWCNNFCWRISCFRETCGPKDLLDLKPLPHMSQVWEIPVIWFASMWLGIAFNGSCFPQTLQVAKYPLSPPAGMSVLVNMSLICPSRSSRSTLIFSCVRDIDASTNLFETGLLMFEFNFDSGICW